MIIYSKNNTVILDVQVDDTSYRYRAIRQGDKVYLYFALTDHVEIPIYSYIDFQGQRYTLWKPENVTKHGERNLEYDVQFGGQWELLNRTKYKFTSDKPHKLKFPLTAKPRMFMQLMVDNLNLHDSGWMLGTCIDAPEKAMAFNHETCMEVINRLADEYNTEFEFVSKTISFGKVERFKDDPLPLSYGKGNGFKTGVGRQSQGDKAPVTILYVQGGDRNIDLSIYKSPTLLLPKKQELEYQGRRYKTDVDGMYITRADRSLIDHNEDSYDAGDIYPSRVGTVSEVIVVDKDKNFYDIKDASIPTALDYTQCRIAGEKATIIFQTGILTGKEFDLEQTDKELTGYIHAERRFKIVPQEIDGQVMPNDTFKPAIGDQYAIFHISLPAAYVCDNVTKTGASWDMFREAVRYMSENEEENFTFEGELDGMWAKKKWLEIGGKLRPGSYIQFSDTQFQPSGIAIRITGIKDYINKPHSPELELSNTPVAGFLSSDLGKLEGNEVKDEGRHNDALSFTKRRWRDAVEGLSMLEAAIAGFSASINPITIQTMAMLVGDESLQFRFVNSKTNPSEIIPDFKYSQSAKVFTVPATMLQHMTLGISKLSSSHTANEYKYWHMSAYTSPPLDVTDAMYLYSKCSKSGTTGSFLLSKTPYKMDPGDGYYYFLTGALSSEFEAERSFVTVYGFTEILPGRITVGMIVSPDGQTYFNVAQGEIGGKLVLKAGSSGLKELVEWTGIEYDIDSAKDAADSAQTKADNAALVAQNATNRLNGWASDNYISPAEKTALKQQGNEIRTEYQEIAGQVARYYLSNTSAWNSYYNVYLSTIVALDKYTASSPENIVVESDYGNIAAYYPYRKHILDAIAAAAKKYVDDAIINIGDPAAGLEELEYLKTAIANETASIGGLLLTSLLKLGIKNGSTWQEKAGINGTARYNSDIVAWFGGTLSQAISDLAAIVFHLDGSGQLAKGNIKWNADGSGQLANGNIKWNTNGSGQLANGNIVWGASGDASFKGKVSTADSGSRIILDPASNRLEFYTDSRLAGYIDFTTDDFKGITPRFKTTYSDGLGMSYTGGGIFCEMGNAKYALNGKEGLHVGYQAWSTSPTNAHFSAMWRYVGSNPRMVLHLHQPPRSADNLISGDIYVDSSNNLKWVP